MATLMNDLGSFLSPELLGRLGGAVGASPDTASRAAGAGLPALVSGLRDVVRTEGGASRIVDVIRAKRYDDPGALSRMESMTRDPRSAAALAPEGQGVLRSIFGARVDDLVSGLGQSTGVDRSAMGGMLALLAPMVLGVIGKRAREDHLDGRGIATLLESERSVAPGEPLGTTVSSAGGAHVFERPERRAAATAPARASHARPKWLVPLLLLAALAIALFFLFRGAGDDRQAMTMVPQDDVEEPPRPVAMTPPEQPERPSAAKPEAAAPATGVMMGAETEQAGATQEPMAQGPAPIEQQAQGVAPMEQQPSAEGVAPTDEPVAQGVEGGGFMPGTEETIAPPEGGIDAFEQALAAEDQALPARFVVDELQFGSGAARFSSGVPSVDRIAELMRTTPTARIRIDGHTDSNGSSELNRDLSQARADEVRAALVERGIEEDRIETSGQGEDQPIASNDTEDGQRQNRRTEVVLLER